MFYIGMEGASLNNLMLNYNKCQVCVCVCVYVCVCMCSDFTFNLVIIFGCPSVLQLQPTDEGEQKREPQREQSPWTKVNNINNIVYLNNCMSL